MFSLYLIVFIAVLSCREHRKLNGIDVAEAAMSYDSEGIDDYFRWRRG
jgi:hypothetical protein